MNRRQVLKGLLAIPCAIVVPLALKANTPILRGDGIHDDTEALQAWFDGKAVRWTSGEMVGKHVQRKVFTFRHINVPRQWFSSGSSFCYNHLKPMVRA